MKRPIKFLRPALLLVGLLLLGSSMAPFSGGFGRVPPRTKARVAAEYASLPLVFEANQGQTDPRAVFLSRAPGFTLFLTQGGPVLSLHKRDRTSPPSVLRMKFSGVEPSPAVAGVSLQKGRSNYFIGNDPGQWRTDIPHYSAVRYAGLYPGIDLLLYGNHQQLEYDLIVAPGARPEQIEIALEGAGRLHVDAGGNLVAQIDDDRIIQRKPKIYQERDGVRHVISGAYQVLGENRVRFAISSFDASLPLVIDPVLTYATFLGGSGDDRGFDIAVDAAGNAYITGSTRSVNFPILGAIQPAKNAGGNGVDVFVTKLNPSGSALIYSSFLGGANPSSEVGNGIAVDSSGNAYITGQTDAPNFPTVNALQPSYGGGPLDAFVAKISASGAALLFSSYLGGSDSDFGTDVAVDSNESLYVTGTTLSTNFPTANALQAVYAGGNTGQTAPPGGDAFVAKLNPSGSAFVFSTYLGGGADDFARGITIDAANNIFVTGSTLSTNFPTMNAFQAAKGTKFDGFVAKLDASGAALTFSTYLGGNGLDDHANGIATDPAGNAYVAGTTTSTNFPTTAGAYQLTRLGSTSPFVARMSGAGSLIFSTYLGTGFGDDIAVDSAGNSYVAGETDATFPLMNPVQGTFGGGAFDIFLAKLNPSGSALIYSTFLGGSATDSIFGHGVAVDAVGSAYVTGVTASINFPTTSGVFQTVKGDAGTTFDAFVAKITDNHAPTADAGEDRVIACQSVAATPVVLDGSGSSDPDNNVLSFLWAGPFPEGGGSASGGAPAVTLALGTSTISLVVNDGQLNSPADTVDITVKVGVAGLLSPLEPFVPWTDPVLIPDKAFKQGRTLPLKLQLSCGATSLTDADVAAPRIVALVREGDAMDLETIDPDVGAANDNGLLLRYSAPNWIYNLSTQGLATGTYVITIEMPDGLRYSAAFVLR